jgi:signal transduction histidine kinase
MVATISHEARTPLAVLSGYASLVALQMQEKNSDPQIAADLDKIAYEAKRVANLIDHMKNLPLQKEKSARKEELDLGNLISQTARLYEQILERRGVAIRIEIPENLPPVFGNAEELSQLIFNLLQNAKNHTFEGCVTVKAEVVENEFIITISDTGSGIAAELLPHVFEHGTHGSEGGTGIGLAICKEVIESHSGKMSIESDSGTKVTVILPVKKEQP